MPSHPNRSGTFELTFWGGTSVRYRRNHKTYEQARDEAHRVLADMDSRGAHPAIINGPGLGPDGITIA
jgi:hypothetical protein